MRHEFSSDGDGQSRSARTDVLTDEKEIRRESRERGRREIDREEEEIIRITARKEGEAEREGERAREMDRRTELKDQKIAAKN